MKDGPIKVIDPDTVPKEPSKLHDGFEWVTMDLTDEKELEEVYELLTGHYVEDDEAMFRFNYSVSFLNWALKSPAGEKNGTSVSAPASLANSLLSSLAYQSIYAFGIIP